MKFITSINPKIINKNFVNNEFTNIELTSKKFYNLVTDIGCAFCVAQLNGEVDKINRKSDNFQSSQIIAIDIDNKDPDKYKSYNDMLKNKLVNNYASFIYATPSHTDEHNRYRIVFVLNKKIEDKELYEKYVNVLIKFFKSDEATKSCAQMFFGTKDCSLSEFFGNILPISTLKKLLLKYDKHINKKRPKVSSLVKVNSKVEPLYNNLDYKEIIEYIFKNNRLKNEDWFLVCSVLKNHSGLSENEIKSEISKYVELGDIDIKFKNAHKYKEINVDYLLSLAQKNGYVIKNNDNECISFSIITNKDGENRYNSSYDYMKLRDQLNNFGYTCIYDENSSNANNEDNLYKIGGFHIKKANKKDIINTIENDIIKASNFPDIVQSDLFRTILGSNKVSNLIELIQTKTNQEIEDYKFKDNNLLTRIPFQNGYLEIEPYNYTFKGWDENELYIYEDTLISRDFIQADDEKSECQQFFEFLCTSYDSATKTLNEMDDDKYNTLCSIFGYLLINYKDKSFAKCIFLTDEDDYNNSNGGTGKSLFLNLLRQVRKLKNRDGKNYDPKSRFNFDNLSLSDDIYAINDINMNFDIKSVYNLITDDFTFEKKGRDSKTLKFNQTPKVVITSNHTHIIDGNSDTRRTIVFEFSSYFSKYNSVKSEFGHLLIDDWSDKEFSRFYKFCIKCIQKYYNNLCTSGEGIPKYDMANHHTKQIKKIVGVEFFDFFNDNISLNKEFRSLDLLEDYERYSGDKVSQTILTQRLKVFSKNIFGIELQTKYVKNEGCKIYIISDGHKSRKLF